MSQIKQTQIIPERIMRTNPSSALPVDLNRPQGTLPSSASSFVRVPGIPFSPSVDAPSFQGESQAGQSTQSALQNADPTPATPAILGVKEQIIKFLPDGTAKIDVILEVQDIEGAVEYDIRVAKDSGSL